MNVSNLRASLCAPRALTASLFAAATMLSAPLTFADDACNPISLYTCGLPYPSNTFTYDDASSPTGVRVAVDNAVIPADVLAQLPADQGITPELLFANTSGFSAAGAVVFELSDAPNEATLPKWGEGVAYAINLTTGEAAPVRTKLNSYAANPDKVTVPRNIVQVFPQSRWAYGDDYVVALTNSLETASGDAFTRSAGLDAVLAGESAEQAMYAQGLTALAQAGVSADDIVALTVFTVRDRAEVVEPLLALTDAAYANEHPVRNLDAVYKLSGPIGVNVTGEVRIDNYRIDNTGVVDFDKTPTEQWVEFTLDIPRSAGETPAPVVIYAHGLGLSKDGTFNNKTNAELGLATFGVDFPNHGSRTEADGGYALASLSIDTLPLEIGMITQSAIDFTSALKAVQTELAGLDALPKKWYNSIYSDMSRNGDGQPDLDLSNISFQGTSLGGVLGVTFASTAPDIKAAYLHVTGVGVTNILGDSVLWDSAFSSLMPEGVTGGEALLLFTAVQQMIDYGDAINFIDYARNPRAGRDARPIAIVAGAGDSIVPNDSTIAAAQLLDAPLIDEAIFEMPNVSQQAAFTDGYGIVQQDINVLGPDADAFLTHILSIFQDRAQDYQAQWLTDYVVE